MTVWNLFFSYLFCVIRFCWIYEFNRPCLWVFGIFFNRLLLNFFHNLLNLFMLIWYFLCGKFLSICENIFSTAIVFQSIERIKWNKNKITVFFCEIHKSFDCIRVEKILSLFLKACWICSSNLILCKIQWNTIPHVPFDKFYSFEVKLIKISLIFPVDALSF